MTALSATVVIMGDRTHLVPTTVTDKHGNAVVRHVRPSSAAGGTGTALPAPRAAAGFVTPANRYRDLVPALEFDREANEKFPLIDHEVMEEVKALLRRNRKWEYATRRMMSKTFGKGMEASGFEFRLRHLLTVASIAERIQERDFILGDTTVERALTESYNLLHRWGDSEWDEAIKKRTAGVLILFAISGELKTGTYGVIKADADWVGARADAVIPLLPHLKERRALTPNAIQQFLDVAHPALAEGAL